MYITTWNLRTSKIILGMFVCALFYVPDDYTNTCIYEYVYNCVWVGGTNQISATVICVYVCACLCICLFTCMRVRGKRKSFLSLLWATTKLRIIHV